MAAYLIADVDITDAAVFEEYRREVPATEQRYGGRYLGRGGQTKVLEGDCAASSRYCRVPGHGIADELVHFTRI
jgi:uncharacterized protein (DUF1330 family)